ncbi:MAG TPA: lipopolysaccharide biosynthesis protein [Vicinamibacteria bacterium]|nr:lipopolysaccharide biosynthesis protein [Vicinamibacteria bacterium]
MTSGPVPPPRHPLSAHLKKLAAHSAVYGAADVFTNVVNFLLFPLYTSYLGLIDYGHLALLITFGTLAKIVFRLGLDAGFFRVHYDMETEEAQRRLAGTVAAFAAGVGLVLFLGVVAGAGPLTHAVLGEEAPARTWVVLVAADVFVGTLTFVPASLLRIQDRPGLFSALAALRHTVNTGLKVLLLVRGWGVAGILWSDLLATTVFALSLLPVLVRHARPAFDRAALKEVLAFGLPKVPHGFLVQVLNVADRWILDLFVPRAAVGLYQTGYTFGAGVKFALSAFEPAWAPFVYAQARREGAPVTLGRVATWAFAAFVWVALAVGVLGRELLVLMTPNNPAFRAAAPVIPVVALAYLFHGLFLLTSVGIGIEKRARYYPMVTAAAAAVNLVLNFTLIPRFGIMGAAWATVAAYAVMAVLGGVFSHRLYPIPFEWGRMGLVALAALATAAAGGLAPSALMPAFAVKGGLLALFGAALFATGLLRWPRGGIVEDTLIRGDQP